MSGTVYGGIYAPIAIKNTPYMGEIIDLYQESFAALPWNERSKCPVYPDIKNEGCAEGYSGLSVGSNCGDCNNLITEEAYPHDELYEKFTTELPDSYRLWYLEKQGDNGAIIMAALARVTTVNALTEQLEESTPELSGWIKEKYQDSESKIVWIEDVFANTELRPKGNLKNFGKMCTLFALGTESTEIAYKTFNPKLVRAAQRDFGSDVTIADPVFEQIPGRNRFVSIKLQSEAISNAA